MLPDGSITSEDGRIFTAIDDGYCIEKYHGTSQKLFNNISNFDNGSTVVLLCSAATESKNDIENKIIYSIMIISVLFLILTLLIYMFLPELRNRHGKIVMCHVSCMLLAFVALCFIKVPRSTGYGPTTCLVIGKLQIKDR